ncbi:MAG: thiosulfate/3-mercaptopyruvate sulfurtransferase [Gammaproteobacteria bacterium]|jgi:thiosulfate/3-mercaptopyruvate sulfurtransferase
MYTNPNYLVETQWLEDHLSDPALRLFDVTGMLTSKFHNLAKENSYDAGHIPGAAFLDVAGRDAALAISGAPIPWTSPSATSICEALGGLGVSSNSRVVLYGASPRPGIDNGTMWCTRAWWLMHSVGVDCAVLNGGFAKWVSEGRSVSIDPHAYPPGSYNGKQTRASFLATKADVLAALDDPHVVVADALPPASYAGASKTAYGPRAGHISGAVSLPMSEVLDENGLFLQADALRAKLSSAGLLDSPRVITYCGAGIAATVDAFALALLGHEGVSVYDASLSEWTADPEVPMTNPSQ